MGWLSSRGPGLAHTHRIWGRLPPQMARPLWYISSFPASAPELPPQPLPTNLMVMQLSGLQSPVLNQSEPEELVW